MIENSTTIVVASFLGDKPDEKKRTIHVNDVEQNPLPLHERCQFQKNLTNDGDAVRVEEIELDAARAL